MSTSYEWKCAECKRLTGTFRRRGLCRECYLNPVKRRKHKPLPKGPKVDVRREAVLRDLFLKGLSDREIAEVTGRTIIAVTTNRHRIGLASFRSRKVAD